MANEKMMILNMLQEGKISAEEAAKLLSSLDDSPRSASESPPRPADSGGTGGMTDVDIRSNDGRRLSDRPADRQRVGVKISNHVDFDELGRKFAAFAKDLEPKLQKVTETVAEKTVYFADKLAKSLDSSALPRMPEETGGYAAGRPSAGTSSTGTSGVYAGGTDRKIELAVDDGYNELSLAGLNSDVTIKGYNGDKISACIRYRLNRDITTRSGSTPIDLMKLGGKYYLNYEEDDFQFVAIDAYVPSQKFKVINISGINGNMDISGLNSQHLQISNSNGQLALSNIVSDSFKSESGNGRLSILNLVADTAILEHFNGAVEAWETDAEKLSITNFNGTLSLNTSAFDRYCEYLWNIETSNAKLTLNIPTLPDLGYHIKARSALGDVKIGLTGLEFLINEPGMIEAKNAAFDIQGKKVRLALETSNAALTVN